MDTLFSYIMCCFFTKCQNYSQTDQHPCPREVGVAQVFASFYDPFNAWDDILLFLHHLMFIRIPTGTDNMAVTWPCLLVHWQHLALILIGWLDQIISVQTVWVLFSIANMPFICQYGLYSVLYQRSKESYIDRDNY